MDRGVSRWTSPARDTRARFGSTSQSPIQRSGGAESARSNGHLPGRTLPLAGSAKFTAGARGPPLVSRSCRSPTRVVRRSRFHPDRRAERPLQQSLVHGSRWRRIMTKALPLVLTAILAVSPALADARPPPVGGRWRPSSPVGVLERVTLRIHWHESLAALREAAAS